MEHDWQYSGIIIIFLGDSWPDGVIVCIDMPVVNGFKLQGLRQVMRIKGIEYLAHGDGWWCRISADVDQQLIPNDLRAWGFHVVGCIIDEMYDLLDVLLLPVKVSLEYQKVRVDQPLVQLIRIKVHLNQPILNSIHYHLQYDSLRLRR